MTGVGSVYGAALYALAREEGLGRTILHQLRSLDESFRQEPDFLRLLTTRGLPKTERCRILDHCFRGKIEPYILNFLKILTNKGYIRHFHACCEAYRKLYDRDNGILRVTAVSAVSLSSGQLAALTERLDRITGRHVELENKLDPAVLGGLRLDYGDRRIDGTLAHRLDRLHDMLKNTAF